MTLAVAVILMVTGAGPHEKRMIPPARTAATTAAEVHEAGVPWPTTRALDALPAAGASRAAQTSRHRQAVEFAGPRRTGEG
jgi:hypothetical protein